MHHGSSHSHAHLFQPLIGSDSFPLVRVYCSFRALLHPSPSGLLQFTAPRGSAFFFSFVTDPFLIPLIGTPIKWPHSFAGWMPFTTFTSVSPSTALSWGHVTHLNWNPYLPFDFSHISFHIKRKGWFSFCLEKWWLYRGGYYYLPKTLSRSRMDRLQLSTASSYLFPAHSLTLWTRCTFFSSCAMLRPLFRSTCPHLFSLPGLFFLPVILPY